MSDPGEISDAPALSDDDGGTPVACRSVASGSGTPSSKTRSSEPVSERRFNKPSLRSPEEKRELASRMREAKTRKALATHKSKSAEAVETFNAAAQPIPGIRMQRMRLEST